MVATHGANLSNVRGATRMNDDLQFMAIRQRCEIGTYRNGVTFAMASRLGSSSRSRTNAGGPAFEHVQTIRRGTASLVLSNVQKLTFRDDRAIVGRRSS